MACPTAWPGLLHGLAGALPGFLGSLAYPLPYLLSGLTGSLANFARCLARAPADVLHRRARARVLYGRAGPSSYVFHRRAGTFTDLIDCVASAFA